MSLKDTLNGTIVHVEGALAAYVMAYDGIAIDEVVKSDSGFDLQLLSVEYATVLRGIKRTVEVVKAGQMEEVIVTTSSLIVIMRVLNDELFLVLIMAKDGNFGKARYMLRLKSFELLRQLG
ncbi:roadblock/LC7 domain-containing protein [Pelotalea chapellei]|uniref:Roadblock/LC7 domain-containing protein n=1 Tax=Pelotalea chapellei TaxID=44671 RepID=A0ABS5U7Q7_9BACT|nr:roadblock/LC7 domain-containing protein [Pelotalea chapellei]MBT1071702.1 roadblock/LC7 domain-containing protein [Pelotalea chapellei]